MKMRDFDFSTIPWQLIIGVVAVVLVLYVLLAAVRVLQEYERGVIFRLGRYGGVTGPGLVLIIPFGIDRLKTVDLRTVTTDVPGQEVITRDNVTIRVNAVLYFQVLDPKLAVIKVVNYVQATMQIAQTTLRSVLDESELDELLANREQINEKLQVIIDQQTEPWGIKVSIVEVKDIELPQTMQRAMAKQAEAEREKRAKIISAEGEFQASAQLANAAQVLAQQPATLQLRYLQTLTEIASERNSTIIFPIPIEFLSMLNGAGGSNNSNSNGAQMMPLPMQQPTAPGTALQPPTAQPLARPLQPLATPQLAATQQLPQQEHPVSRFDPLTGQPLPPEGQR